MPNLRSDGRPLLVVAIVLFIQILTTGLLFAQGKENRDYCLQSGTIRLVLIDITTEYDQRDKAVVVGTLDEVFAAAKGGDRIVVKTIADSHAKSERLIERCVPQCAADGFFNRLFNCSDGLLRTDTETMRDDIVKILRSRLAKFEELKYSDIVRTITMSSREESRAGQQLNLYIYSDLIENSDYFPGRYLFVQPLRVLMDGLKKWNLIAALNGVEVLVSGVGRAGTVDRRPLTVPELNKLNEFWQAYFQEGKAKSVKISQNAIQ